MINQNATVSDKTVREVIRGLMVIALVMWIGIFVLEFRYRTVEPSIIVAVTGITGGLVGIVSLRHGGSDTSVTAADDTTVNVGGPDKVTPT